MKFIAFEDAGEKSIEAVQNKFKIAKKDTYIIRDKDARSRKDDMQEVEGPFEEFIILGHTGDDAKKGKTTLGDYSAKEFAEKLALKVHPTNRLQVKHVYIIGCEVGMSKEGKPALAQEIANELSNQGFKNIQVHAITNPSDAPCYGMRVEVVSRPGAPGKILGHQPGQLVSHLHATPRQEALCMQLSEEPEKELTIIADKEEYKSRPTLVDTSDARNEFLRKQNTFIPGGHGPLSKKILAQEQFIVLVEREARTTPNKKLAAKLNKLLPNLKKASSTEWEKIIIEALIPYYDEKGVIGKLQNKARARKHDPESSTFCITMRNFYAHVGLSEDNLVRQVKQVANKKEAKGKDVKTTKEEEQPLLVGTDDRSKKEEKTSGPEKQRPKKGAKDHESTIIRRATHHSSSPALYVDPKIMAVKSQLRLISSAYEIRRPTDNWLKNLCFFKPKSSRTTQLNTLMQLGQDETATEGKVREGISKVLTQLRGENNKLKSTLQNILEELIDELDGKKPEVQHQKQKAF
ncbi:hypothetical protein ACQUW5_08205 [Legionella sp. CNM-1927-20]|uniref:hypothetical protein n=1 Tax=Legionella sp. CNM-1927-20 TaxID=3422221 RepID=UPI00403B0B34